MATMRAKRLAMGMSFRWGCGEFRCCVWVLQYGGASEHVDCIRARGTARGMELLQISGALDVGHILPGSLVKPSFTTAPARRDRQALARRAAHLISGGVIERPRERDCPLGGAAGRSILAACCPPAPQHFLHQGTCPLGRPDARLAATCMSLGGVNGGGGERPLVCMAK